MKKRTIINIRELNKIIESNNYFMQQQSNIIFVVQKCRYITTINCNEFFY